MPPTPVQVRLEDPVRLGSPSPQFRSWSAPAIHVADQESLGGFPGALNVLCVGIGCGVHEVEAVVHHEVDLAERRIVGILQVGDPPVRRPLVRHYRRPRRHVLADLPAQSQGVASPDPDHAQLPGVHVNHSEDPGPADLPAVIGPARTKTVGPQGATAVCFPLALK